MIAYLGVDWSASEVVCSSSVDGAAPRKIEGAKPKLTEVMGLLARVKERHAPATEVRVVIEAGAGAWARLFHAAGAVVYVIDPSQAKRFRESLSSSGAKDDQRDADALVMLGQSRCHQLTAWCPDERAAELRQHADAHEQISDMSGREQQRLRALLRESMPLVDAAIPDVTSQWAQRFLREASTPWHAKRLSRTTFDALLGRRVRASRREELWTALCDTEAPWLTEAEAEAVARRVVQSIDRLALYEAQLADVDAEIERCLDATKGSELLLGIDGIGTQLASAILLFGIGNGTQSRDEAAIRMGAAPVFVGSGRTAKGRPKGAAKMRRAAPPRAKQAAYLIGRLAMRHLPWARAMYSDARRRQQDAATAFRRIARCLLRIVTAMLRDGKPYDDTRYVASLKAKGVPWATGLASGSPPADSEVALTSQ